MWIVTTVLLFAGRGLRLVSPFDGIRLAGSVSERQGAGLQNPLRRFDSDRNLNLWM